MVFWVEGCAAPGEPYGPRRLERRPVEGSPAQLTLTGTKATLRVYRGRAGQALGAKAMGKWFLGCMVLMFIAGGATAKSTPEAINCG